MLARVGRNRALPYYADKGAHTQDYCAPQPYTYDIRDRLETRTDAALQTESYDGEGHLTFHTSRQGQVTGHLYDALGRRTQTGFGAASTAAPVYTAPLQHSYDDAKYSSPQCARPSRLKTPDKILAPRSIASKSP